MTDRKVCILDYGSGNVGSVLNMLRTLTPQVEVSNDGRTIREATHFILPGVGAFGASIRRIGETIPLAALAEEVHGKRKPFLGICVGMHVLAEKGHEFGTHDGLGWIPGEVSQLRSGDLPLPHVGWNDIEPTSACPLFDRFGERPDFYFVHSYVFRSRCAEHVAAVTDYGERFAAVVRKDNIYGVQFHPEKSQQAGRVLLDNFLALT